MDQTTPQQPQLGRLFLLDMMFQEKSRSHVSEV